MATDQTTRLEAATVKAENGSQIVYDFANGPATATVQTASGAIPTLAGKLDEISDTLAISAGIYPTTAAGLDATNNGQVFLVYASDDDDIIYRVYQNQNGTAFDTGKNTISGTDLEQALAQAEQSADSAMASAGNAQTAAQNAVAAVQDFKDSGGASLVGFNSGTVGGRLSSAYSIQDFTKSLSAASLSEANQLLAALPSHSIVEWGPYNYTLDQSQLSAGGKTLLHILNGSTFNGDYDSALPGLSLGVVASGVRVRRLRGATGGDVGDWWHVRDANYTGGTAGNVNAALRAATTVRAGAAAYEWNLLATLDNYATGTGENCASYFQAIKRADGSTWANVAELRDMTVSPATSSVAIEVDLFANGLDASNNRVMIDLVAGRVDAAGAQNVVGYGIRYRPQANNTNNAALKFGIDFGGSVDVVLNGQGTGTQFVRDIGSRAVGIDLIGATYSVAAIRLPDNGKIVTDSSGSTAFRYNATAAQWELLNGTSVRAAFAVSAFALRDSNSQQVLGVRNTGWLAVSNSASADKASAFNAAWTQTISASYTQSEVQALATQLALVTKRLAAIQVAFTTHGAIGA